MRVLTWNINSVRLRINLLEKLASEEVPDVICLQETKTPDEFFPAEAIEGFGYKHLAFHGMKGYNGVAILSKFPLENIRTHARTGKEDCRHISANIMHPQMKTPVSIHNLYIPAGGDAPDPDINDKFQHKLDFVEELTEWFPSNENADAPVIALGDMNIAPLENDVWSHKQMLKVVSHTPAETDRFAEFYKSMNWTDAMRHFVPEEEKLYSWWSYRARDWAASDRGRRLDHVWVTEPLAPLLKSCNVLRDARGWERPSDHVPVIIDFKVKK
ncbi:MAG: exodeoxyribonuclease III [Alphaproteobacteria bacterium]|nr:MAG: exodeoxyribonuclease III [Alphaproteobacteria bacterium]